ncbi:MAG: CatB-related O-acetyltransferase [Maricaulaceae bacterium]|nr:CatB-related O-acetyltransferase [Maricaulaceae bacterium]
MHGPDPSRPYPMQDHPRVCFIRNVVTAPNIEIGEYTYYDDPDHPERFAEKCVLYHYDFMGDRLVIGRFCALAAGVTFIMNGANHAMTGFSTFPFQIFGGGWERDFDFETIRAGYRGDTVVGHDVWIGRGAVIMPGLTIGHGAIIASESVVVDDVPPYAIAGGNPARVIRTRFDEATVASLLDIAWWDWDVEKISRNLKAVMGADLAALRSAA